uniref:Cell shape-determining protein MreC n=1 Tax=candidate division WOR-3 bacterium TaxID=2052148 RepID=A0A7V3ZYQ0_UNCW3
MEKKLFVLFFLLTIFVNIRGVKEEVAFILSKSFYFPFIYTRNLLLLLYNVERNSIKLNIENQKLREQLNDRGFSENNFIGSSSTACVGEILQYIPLGIPEEIVVKVKSEKIGSLIEGTVVDLNGYLVGKVEMEGGELIRIKTIYDESFKVGVESIHPYYTGILQGGEIPLVLYVPIDAEIHTGDTLYTSRLSSYAKPYIPVGTVKDYQKDIYNPIFYRAKIEPFFKPFTSRIVVIYGKSKN